MSEGTKTKESKIARFFKGVQAEFRKIIWPDRDAIIRETLAVVVISVIVGVIIALLDFGFQNLIDVLTTFTLS